MTQNDFDNDRLVCPIGVAPLRPAEFVIFRIGQKTVDARRVPGGERPRHGGDAALRGGNFRDNTPMKATGTYKVIDVTLKRGVIGDLDTRYVDARGWTLDVHTPVACRAASGARPRAEAPFDVM